MLSLQHYTLFQKSTEKGDYNLIRHYKPKKSQSMCNISLKYDAASLLALGPISNKNA